MPTGLNAYGARVVSVVASVVLSKKKKTMTMTLAKKSSSAWIILFVVTLTLIALALQRNTLSSDVVAGSKTTTSSSSSFGYDDDSGQTITNKTMTATDDYGFVSGGGNDVLDQAYHLRNDVNEDDLSSHRSEDIIHDSFLAVDSTESR